MQVELQRGTESQNSREEITQSTDVHEDELIPAELTLEDERELEASGRLDPG